MLCVVGSCCWSGFPLDVAFSSRIQVLLFRLAAVGGLLITHKLKKQRMLAKNKTKIICTIGHACRQHASVHYLTSVCTNANRLLSRILSGLKARSCRFELGSIFILPTSFFPVIADPAHAVSVSPGCLVMSGASDQGEGPVFRGSQKISLLPAWLALKGR